MPALMTPAGRALLSGKLSAYSAKVLDTAPANLLAYWPLSEASGSVAADLSANARNGAYTGVDLGSPGIGDGRTSPYFDGVNDYGNMYSAGLATAFNGAEGTLCLWLKMFDATAWAGAAVRVAAIMSADAQNQIAIYKSAANQLTFQYLAGTVSKSVVKSSVSTLLWMHLAISWSKSGDQVKAYFNGVQEGTTQTSLGVYAGSLAATRAVIGANTTTPVNITNGYIAHAALWSTPLTAAQIAALAVVS